MVEMLWRHSSEQTSDHTALRSLNRSLLIRKLKLYTKLEKTEHASKN